jgi:hypothetical protein
MPLGQPASGHCCRVGSWSIPNGLCDQASVNRGKGRVAEHRHSFTMNGRRCGMLEEPGRPRLESALQDSFPTMYLVRSVS